MLSSLLKDLARRFRSELTSELRSQPPDTGALLLAEMVGSLRRLAERLLIIVGGGIEDVRTAVEGTEITVAIADRDSGVID